MSEVRALGYVRIRATDMEAWRTFATESIGFAVGTGPEAHALHLRLDERHARLVIVPGDHDRVEAVGWEVGDHLALGRVRDQVAAADIEHARPGVQPCLTDEVGNDTRVHRPVAGVGGSGGLIVSARQRGRGAHQAETASPVFASALRRSRSAAATETT